MRILAFAALALCTLYCKIVHEIVDADDPDMICKDTKYYLNRQAASHFESKKNACPIGYSLAELSDQAAFNHAAIFLFSCLGPGKEAWISTAQGTLYAKGDPVKLIAPDAIEKGGPPLGLSSYKHEPQYQPIAPRARKIRSTTQRKSRLSRKSKRNPSYVPPRATIYEKSAAPRQPVDTQPAIRTLANVVLDSPEAILPFLCQQDSD